MPQSKDPFAEFLRKPRLRPSLVSSRIKPVHILLYSAFISTLVSAFQPRAVLSFIKNAALSQSAELAVAGTLFLLLDFLIYILAIACIFKWESLFRAFLPFLGYRRLYHRSHISHMRIDKLQRLLRRLPAHRPTPVICGGGFGFGGVNDKVDLDGVRAWIEATLANNPAARPHVDEAMSRATHLLRDRPPAHLPTPPNSLRKEQLAGFLSDSWLDDEMVTAGCEYVIHHSQSTHPHAATAMTFHVPMLRSRFSSSTTYKPESTLDSKIMSGNTTLIFLPLHVYGNHWTLLRIDLSNHTLSYADCRDHSKSPPEDILPLIVWWLSSLGHNFHNVNLTPFEFTLPQQNDTHSCGIIVMSLMATMLLGDDVWSQTQAGVKRMQWFLRLAPAYSEPQPTAWPRTTVHSLPPPSNSLAPPPPPPSTPPSTSPTRPIPPPSLPPNSPIPSAPSSGKQSPPTLKPTKRKAKKTIPDDVDLARWTTFTAKIRHLDPHAEADPSQPLTIRCSSCCSLVSLRAMYDVRAFKVHRKSRRCLSHQKTGTFTQSLFAMGFSRQSTQCSSPSPPPLSLPCPGLTTDSNPRIRAYISRTTVSTGGAPSRLSIARQLFTHRDDISWRVLTKEQRQAVLRAEEQQAQWIISRASSAVYSMACATTVVVRGGDTPSPCPECKALFKVRLFRNALRRPMPTEENMKYVPRAYQSEDLRGIYLRITGLHRLMEVDDGVSPLLKFARGVANGEFKNDVLEGMVEAFVVKMRRQQEGKGLQNMRYSSAFGDFCNTLSSLSPLAYRTFRHSLGGKTLESLRQARAKQLRFEPGFSARNVAAAANLIKQYGYTGPLSLGWDDTELLPAISIYQESKDVCLLVGASSGIIRVEGSLSKSLDDVITEARSNMATKLRIFVLTIPLPKVPPIMVAAVARGSSNNANELHNMHQELIALLSNYDIHPVTGAADGTITEQNVQQLAMDAMSSRKYYSIPNSVIGKPATIDITIGLYKDKYPFVPVQDPKHGAKTGRNQILSGARLLSFGNDVIHFRQLLDAASHPNGPLFARDVDRLDRQDDRAAARVFSAQMLDFHLEQNGTHFALPIYLFVIGELIDAWQNRTIGHAVRAKMVMRARFVLMAWRAHIVSHPAHSLHTHFISHESFDIFLTLCDSLLSLIIIYRTYFSTFPLLPWLHSTEPCEHIFGILRQLKADFTYLDALLLERKLSVLLTSAFNNLTPDQQPNDTAAGYFHTYFYSDDTALRDLANYPTDQVLASTSDTAYREARDLLTILGISADDMMRSYTPPSGRRYLPPSPPSPSTYPNHSLASLLSLFDNTWRGSVVVDDELAACHYAIIADNVAATQEICELPEASAADIANVRKLLVQYGLDVQYDPTEVPPTELEPQCTKFTVTKYRMDRSALVCERVQHQSVFTARSTRRSSTAHHMSWMNRRTVDRCYLGTGPTLREELTARLQELAAKAAADSSRSGAGVSRQVRYTGTHSSYSSTTQTMNKATVRNETAKTFLRLRDQAFAPVRALHENFPMANITSLNRLEPGHFIIALSPVSDLPEVILGKVVTMYAKGNGRNAKYEYLENTSSLGLPSYIDVQQYVRAVGDSVFSSVACQDLLAPTFLKIPRTHLLFSLGSFRSIKEQPAGTVSNGNKLTLVSLCPGSTALFTAFASQQDLLYTYVTNLSRAVSHTRRSATQAANAEAVDPASSLPLPPPVMDAETGMDEVVGEGEESSDDHE